MKIDWIRLGVVANHLYTRFITAFLVVAGCVSGWNLVTRVKIPTWAPFLFFALFLFADIFFTLPSFDQLNESDQEENPVK